jgi:hypothetical protein
VPLLNSALGTPLDSMLTVMEDEAAWSIEAAKRRLKRRGLID